VDRARYDLGVAFVISRKYPKVSVLAGRYLE